MAPPPDHQPSLADASVQISRERPLHHYPVPERAEKQNLVNVNGAGDSLSATVLAALMHGHTFGHSIELGMRAARLSLESWTPISPEVTPVLLDEPAADQ